MAKPKNKPIVIVGYNGEYYFPIKISRRVPCRSFYYNLNDLLEDFPSEVYKVKLDLTPVLFEAPIIEINPF